jgi:chromate reductase, NAD(P)H dehydrogenase (quinone)
LVGERVVHRAKVLLVSGSLRNDSTNTALLRTAAVVSPPEITAQLYGAMGELPHFNPDLDQPPLDPAVAHLRRIIHSADALLFSTPEYAGALPGSFKNLLDWTIGDEHSGSIYRKPVAWVNTSAAPTGAADAYASLRRILAYAHASLIEEACTAIPVARHAVHDGLLADPRIRSSIIHTLRLLAEAARKDSP